MHHPRWAGRLTLLAAGLCAALLTGTAFAQSKDIKIAHIYSKTCLLYTSPSPRD